MTPLRPRPLAVRDTPDRGRGVFAVEPIEAGELIEECPVILVEPEQVTALLATALDDYFFWWGGEGHGAAIALGYGSLYNHAGQPNAWFVRKYEAKTIMVCALQPILAGEEITIHYSSSPGDLTPLWFEQAGRPRRKDR
jgi:hypothetical protein